MSKRGDIAREKVKRTIIEAFKLTGNYCGIQDGKKIYVTAKDDSGEIIQFAISFTMPKTAVNFDEMPQETKNGDEPPWETELSDSDKAQVEKLKNKLRELGVYED